MKRLNTQNIGNPFIDADYYTNIFKPNKNAMIIGSFNNVDSHVADFDAFRARASELVDRLVGNKITEVGGIEYVSPTPQMFLRKATASFVQYWYIAGYTPADIDNTVSIGSVNIHQLKNNETFRKYIPLDALLLIQKSGMWENAVFGVDITKRIRDLGIDTTDIVFMSEALQIFQQKNKYDDNFHVDIDYSSELSAQQIDRWIKIVETPRSKVSFEIMGGSKDEIAKALLVIDANDLTAGNTEAYIYSTKLVAQDQKPDYYVKKENGMLSVYVKVDDDIDPADAHLLISNIYADEAGEYKLFGSQTNDSNLTQVNKSNVLQDADITILEQKIAQVEQDIATIQGEVAKINKNEQDINALKQDNTSNKNRLNTIESQQSTNTGNIGSNTQNILTTESKVTTLNGEVIKKDGSTDFDAGFTPKNPQSPATKAIVDALESKLRNDFQTLSGYETEWEGSETPVEDTTNTDQYKMDLNPLTPQLGQAFEFKNKKQINLTFETTQREETITTRIGNDGKWDDVFREYQIQGQTTTLTIVQARITTAGILEIRGINEETSAVSPLPEIPTLVAIHQVTGNVYSTSSVDVDDTKINELEGITI